MSIISPSASGSSPASPNRCREALRDNEPTQSEDRYALAMEWINESVYGWDVGSGAVYISPPACWTFRLKGATPDKELRVRFINHQDKRRDHAGARRKDKSLFRLF
jgi:hypothetical protein